MDLKMHWFLPTSGDGRGITGRAFPAAGEKPGAAAVERSPDIEYMAQIARSAEQLGFEGVLTPTGVWCEDAWLVTSALTRDTERLKYIVAFRPGLTSPTLAAHMARPYQRLSRGRLLLNVVTGGHPDELRRFGDFAPHDERYARCDEFLAVVRGAWGAEPFDFSGKFYRTEGATASRRLPDLGRAARPGRGENRLGPEDRRGTRPQAALRDKNARHRQRPGAGCLGGSGASAQPGQRG